MQVRSNDPLMVRIAELGVGPAEVGRARRELSRRLLGWGVVGQEAHDALLLTNELVTNAIRHAEAPVVLSAGVLSSGRLRIEVHDGSETLAVRRDPGHDDVDGRGLLMVEAVAESWGCGARDGGKHVWFQLAVPHPVL